MTTTDHASAPTPTRATRPRRGPFTAILTAAVTVALTFGLAPAVGAERVDRVLRTDGADRPDPSPPRSEPRAGLPGSSVVMACHRESPCGHPVAAKRKTKTWKQGRIGKWDGNFRIPRSFKRKAIRAYERQYRVTRDEGRAWWEDFVVNVASCVFEDGDAGLGDIRCAGEVTRRYTGPAISLVNVAVRSAMREVGRVTWACGGEAAIGQLAGKKLWLKGWVGFGIGASQCLWREYQSDVWDWMEAGEHRRGFRAVDAGITARRR